MCESATVIAFGIMLFISNTTTGMILAFIFAVIYAIALPLETLVIPLIVNEMFGVACYDKVLGIMIAMNYTGYALGTPIVNICYDAFNSYKPAFIIFMILMPLIGIMFQFAIKGVEKDKLKLQNFQVE
jgi:predicted MFS family arabinose efflux permease